jgi:hypothetical protein
LSVGATDAHGGAFCTFSNRGVGLQLTAPGCNLDGANPSGGEPVSNYWQGTSEASVIAAAALTALQSYRPELSPPAAETALTQAHRGALDIAQAFLDAGAGAAVSNGEAARPGSQPAQGPILAIPPQSVAPSTVMERIMPFWPPRPRLRRIKGRLTLVLASRPSEALVEVRYLGRRHHSSRLRVLRTIRGAFGSSRVPTGVLELSVRYTDPYDLERASHWVVLRVPGLATRTSKPHRA